MSDLRKNREIFLVSGFNKAYLDNAMPYLETMNRNSNVNNIIVTLDFDIDPDCQKKFGSIQFIKVLSSQIKSPNSNTCMQHGGFLEALGFVKDDDILIFTDTDIKIQRPFNESELKILASCEDGDVFVNFNMEEECILLDDAMVLEPNVTAKELTEKYPELSIFKSYNTGVITANYKTYNQLYQKYNHYWPDFSPLLAAYVKQQVLLCYLIQKYFHVKVLPYTIHSHANSSPIKKYSNKKRIGYIGDGGPTGFKLSIGSEVVVFNHHIKHENELEIKRLRKKIRSWHRIVLFLVFLLFVAILMILT
ncbi:MAG TPA: hypothetical protein ENI08_02665 [Candidatus Dependentiae bacterium]|nr:hypothetical protein [Candidatus Dependentiae bacterium]